MKNKKPIVHPIYTKNGSFIGAYPKSEDEYELPGKYPLEEVFLHGSVASANDCTGVAVVMPETEEEGKSISSLHDGIPLSYKENNNEPTSRPAPQRHQ